MEYRNISKQEQGVGSSFEKEESKYLMCEKNKVGWRKGKKVWGAVPAQAEYLF